MKEETAERGDRYADLTQETKTDTGILNAKATGKLKNQPSIQEKRKPMEQNKE